MPKAIMVMFDSLNRHMLSPYGCDWVKTPNFQRLAEKSVTFDQCYVGSMPCIPARRELHTGRYNFLHREWGPLEPFDDSMPAILKEQGIYTHLVTDHLHYMEDGGVGYHTRYNTWEFFRGQEGDLWKGHVADPESPDDLHNRKYDKPKYWRQHYVNQQYFHSESDHPQAKTFEAGLAFIETNHAQDNWFLQLETFDPHEPFLSPSHYKDLYPDDYDGLTFDWPRYRPVTESEAEIEHVRHHYAALVSMCDTYLGQVLDMMDKYDLWDDTLLIVNTDHGFLLGEHDWWGKVLMPFYNEIAHIPLFVWNPQTGIVNERRDHLVQTIDIPATILDYFDIALPSDMLGRSMTPVIAQNAVIHEAVLFGIHGAHINVTDGNYIYMLAPDIDQPIYNYTLMPTRMLGYFASDELSQATMSEDLSCTKHMPVLRIPASYPTKWQNLTDLLFDIQKDPAQQFLAQDDAVSTIMKAHIFRLLQENDAPSELYKRFKLNPINQSE